MLLITGAARPPTAKDSDFAPVPPEFVAERETAFVPATVGMPKMSPVEGLTVNPEG